jgi:hypothetical protein
VPLNKLQIKKIVEFTGVIFHDFFRDITTGFSSIYIHTHTFVNHVNYNGGCISISTCFVRFSINPHSHTLLCYSHVQEAHCMEADRVPTKSLSQK